MAKDLQFTFKRPCLEVSGEVGSLAELIGYMQEQSAALTMAFGDDMELIVQRIAGATGEPSGPAVETDAQRKRREKAEKKNQAGDPVAAVAPAPLPVPEAPLAPPAPPASLEIPADGSIPPFLARTAAPPLAPPVAPPAPIAPPVASAAPPPVGVLGPKVVAALDVLKVGKPDGGQALADWLAAAGVTIKGATYDDACRAVLMISDEKLTAAGVPAALKIAA